MGTLDVLLLTLKKLAAPLGGRAGYGDRARLNSLEIQIAQKKRTQTQNRRPGDLLETFVWGLLEMKGEGFFSKSPETRSNHMGVPFGFRESRGR